MFKKLTIFRERGGKLEHYILILLLKNHYAVIPITKKKKKTVNVTCHKMLEKLLEY